jgi:hypothetical protein
MVTCRRSAVGLSVRVGVWLIELADVIRQLRVELDNAGAAADGEDLRFELGPIDLEVTVGLEAVGGGEGRVRFWVVELGGDARATSISTQRIRLTLNPTTKAGGLSDGGDRRRPAYVSDSEAAGER